MPASTVIPIRYHSCVFDRTSQITTHWQVHLHCLFERWRYAVGVAEPRPSSAGSSRTRPLRRTLCGTHTPPGCPKAHGRQTEWSRLPPGFRAHRRHAPPSRSTRPSASPAPSLRRARSLGEIDHTSSLPTQGYNVTTALIVVRCRGKTNPRRPTRRRGSLAAPRLSRHGRSPGAGRS